MNKKATTLKQVNSAVQFNEPVGPDHPYYTDFSKVRGDFEERVIYRELNVDPDDFTYDIEPNLLNKTLLFLGGMRGSGKTSEIAKYVKNMHNPDCFYCVTCNIDDGLDMNNIEYMDILIFQLERLATQLKKDSIKIDKGGIKSLEKWFDERVKEIDNVIEGKISVEGGIGLEKDGFWYKLLGILVGLKAGVTGSVGRSEKIRTVFKNNFGDFALKANEFIALANVKLEEKGKAKEVFFVIDGLEKTYTPDIRRKIILNESNRIKQIKVNTLFTLPIELASEQRKIDKFSTVENFPFVKIIGKDGSKIEAAYEKFREFIYKRIDINLFANDEIVEKAIYYGGGAPRELLRVLKTAALYTDEGEGVITEQSMNKALKRLANKAARHLTENDWKELRTIAENNKNGKETHFSDGLAELIEKILVMEYNDGTYKRIHPILELSFAYQQEIIEKTA